MNRMDDPLPAVSQPLNATEQAKLFSLKDMGVEPQPQPANVEPPQCDNEYDVFDFGGGID